MTELTHDFEGWQPEHPRQLLEHDDDGDTVITEAPEQQLTTSSRRPQFSYGPGPASISFPPFRTIRSQTAPLSTPKKRPSKPRTSVWDASKAYRDLVNVVSQVTQEQSAAREGTNVLYSQLNEESRRIYQDLSQVYRETREAKALTQEEYRNIEVQVRDLRREVANQLEKKQGKIIDKIVQAHQEGTQRTQNVAAELQRTQTAVDDYIRTLPDQIQQHTINAIRILIPDLAREIRQ